MSRLRPEKLHTAFDPSISPEAPLIPRRYTLTHSDATGDLFLYIGGDYDQSAISGWQRRFMRDEVLGEWLMGEAGPELHLYCHVSGGFVLGSARWRYAIFQKELPLVLEAICFGDRPSFSKNPALESAPIFVHFLAKQDRRSERAHV